MSPSVVNMRISHPQPPITRRPCQSEIRLGLRMELSWLKQKLNCVTVFSQREAFNLQRQFLFFDAGAVEWKAQTPVVCKIGCTEKKQHRVASNVNGQLHQLIQSEIQNWCSCTPVVTPLSPSHALRLLYCNAIHSVITLLSTWLACNVTTNNNAMIFTATAWHLNAMRLI